MSGAGVVAFCASGGAKVGLGHVRRCLALAGQLRWLGAESFFLLDGDAAVADLVTAAGYEVIRIERELADTRRHCESRRANAIVADSYELTTSDFRALAGLGRAVVAIDDLADRELPVHLVVNGSVGAPQLRYWGSPHTRYLLGPRYIPLRQEFAQPPARIITNEVRRVLITLGGSDPHGLTVRLVRWVAKALGGVTQDVVVGPYFPDVEAIRMETLAGVGPITLHENPPAMRDLMLSADLAICGGGQTTYELAATGTPAIAIRLAENQTFNLRGLAEAGTLVWVGDAGDADLESALTDALVALANHPEQRAEMSRRGRELVDGQGAARVAEAIMGLVRGSTP